MKTTWTARTRSQLLAALARKGFERDEVRRAMDRAEESLGFAWAYAMGEVLCWAYISVGNTEIEMWDAELFTQEQIRCDVCDTIAHHPRYITQVDGIGNACQYCTRDIPGHIEHIAKVTAEGKIPQERADEYTAQLRNLAAHTGVTLPEPEQDAPAQDAPDAEITLNLSLDDPERVVVMVPAEGIAWEITGTASDVAGWLGNATELDRQAIRLAAKVVSADNRALRVSFPTVRTFFLGFVDGRFRISVPEQDTETTECATCGSHTGPDRRARWESGQTDLTSWDRCATPGCDVPLCDGCAATPDAHRQHTDAYQPHDFAAIIGRALAAGEAVERQVSATMICTECREDTPRNAVVEVPGDVPGMPLFVCPACALGFTTACRWCGFRGHDTTKCPHRTPRMVEATTTLTTAQVRGGWPGDAIYGLPTEAGPVRMGALAVLVTADGGRFTGEVVDLPLDDAVGIEVTGQVAVPA